MTLWHDIRDYVLKTLRILFSIAGFLGFLWFLVWSGWKGILTFTIGMGIMAFLILSKNPLLMGIINLFHASNYIDKIFEAYDEKISDKSGHNKTGEGESQSISDDRQRKDGLSENSGSGQGEGEAPKSP